MLRELQQHFFHGLFRNQNDSPILELIDDSGARSPVEQLAVYRDSVFGGLTKALAGIYPVCRKLVGERFFDAMAGRFIVQIPSCSPDLNDYGDELAAFIAGFPPAAPLPYLPDVARLEWAWHQAFNSADRPGIDMQALAEIDEARREHIVFRLAKSTTLLASAYPIHRIWEVNQDEYKGDDSVDLDEGGVKLIVWRHDLTMRIDPVKASEWRLLTELAQGRSFGRVCERFSRHHPANDIGAVLAGAIQRGWIASFDLHPDPRTERVRSGPVSKSVLSRS